MMAAGPADAPDDDALRALLTGVRTIAVIGASPDPTRPSYGVMQYLKAASYHIVPVNPNARGTTILGEPVVGDLSELPMGEDSAGSIDLVDVFRAPGAIPTVLDDVLAAQARLNIRYLWLQLGIRHEAAADKARAAGLIVVQDRCSKIEHARLLGAGTRSAARPFI